MRLAWPELGWLQQQADSIPPVPVTRPAMRPQQETSMCRANSLALEKAKPQSGEKQMDSQAKLQTPLRPEMLPGQESPRDSCSEKAQPQVVRPLRAKLMPPVAVTQ